ncbi:hypothetical protein LCGC14_2553720, partial [marine sediment metagenome]
EIKTGVVAILIYCTMGVYLAAALAMFLRARKLGTAIYLAGFAVAAVAFGVRWNEVEHVPLQNLFEVFLCLGMLICPLSLFCKRFMRVGGMAADCLIGVIVLFPAGFVFNAEPQKLPPALQSWLFAPHVAAYMAAYMIMAKAAVQAVGQLRQDRLGGPEAEGLVGYEAGAYKMVRLGFPLLTLGLILGAWWGKLAWGDYWNWDPKELWSLVSWLVYAAYLHFRYIYGRRRPKANSLFVLGGMAAIIITLLWVNLSRIFSGLHSYAS